MRVPHFSIWDAHSFELWDVWVMRITLNAELDDGPRLRLPQSDNTGYGTEPSRYSEGYPDDKYMHGGLNHA